jgi:hypothetical protein
MPRITCLQLLFRRCHFAVSNSSTSASASTQALTSLVG